MGLIKQSGIYVFGRALPALVGLASIALYTRLLDPASVGAYAVLLSTSLLASGIAYSWLRVGALRVAAGGPAELEPDFAATLGLMFIATSGAIALIEGVALHFFFKPVLPFGSLLLAVGAAVASAWYELNGTLLQARLSVVSWGILNLARAGAALVFSVALIFAGLKTDALLAGFVAGNAATLMFASLWWPARKGSFNWSLLQRLWMIGWPSSIASAMGLLSPAFQRYVLVVTAQAGAVGIYAVSQDFATQTLMVLIGSISLAGIPLAFKAKDSGEPEAVSAQLRDNARLIFAVALPVALGLAALAGPISHVFLGPRFRSGADVVMALIAISTLLGGLKIYYFDQAFLLAHQTRPQAIISGVATGVVLAASLLLIPRFAAVGAALSALCGSIAGVVLSMLWGSRLLHMPIPLRSWGKTALAAAGMVLAVLIVPAQDGVVGLTAVVVFGAIVYASLSTATRLELLRTRFGHRLGWLQRS